MSTLHLHCRDCKTGQPETGATICRDCMKFWTGIELKDHNLARQIQTDLLQPASGYYGPTLRSEILRRMAWIKEGWSLAGLRQPDFAPLCTQPEQPLAVIEGRQDTQQRARILLPLDVTPARLGALLQLIPSYPAHPFGLYRPAYTVEGEATHPILVLQGYLGPPCPCALCQGTGGRRGDGNTWMPCTACLEKGRCPKCGGSLGAPWEAIEAVGTAMCDHCHYPIYTLLPSPT